MRKYLLGTVIGLCMLGLAAPSGAVPDTDTLFGEVTEILNPDTALDWVVGTPVTVEAEWDTDGFIDIAEFGYAPGAFFIVPLDDASVSLTITLGSETWIKTDQFFFAFPFLLFDAEGDFLGPLFGGENSDGNIFGTATFNDLISDEPLGEFRAGSPGPAGVYGIYDVPGWDGDFPVLIPEPGSLALLSLGLLGLGVTRRRMN